ncbi:hypothetical protein E5Y90_10920 [Acinetobacter sp. 10FS3-1]|nr:hypothetical protein E5Y90_10920 [Acinetobacter sp. 10FS3-1]
MATEKLTQMKKDHQAADGQAENTHMKDDEKQDLTEAETHNQSSMQDTAKKDQADKDTSYNTQK